MQIQKINAVDTISNDEQAIKKWMMTLTDIPRTFVVTEATVPVLKCAPAGGKDVGTNFG